MLYIICNICFYMSSMDYFLSIFLYFKSRPLSIILFYHTYIVDRERVAYCISLPLNLKSFNFSEKIYTHFSVESE